MLEINERINGNGGPEIGVKTKEGEFIISYENGNLYIGCFESQYKSDVNDDKIEFTIPKENKNIYNIFSKFIRKSNVNILGNLVDYEIPNFTALTSDDYAPNESSLVVFEQDNKQVKITFNKSTSKDKLNSYFIEIKNAALTTPRNVVLLTLLNDLICNKYEQLPIDNIDEIVICGTSRVRTDSRVSK